VALRRVVVLPRTLVAARSRGVIVARLAQCAAFAALPEAQRAFLFDTVLAEVDAAIRAARPSIAKPVRTPDEWVCIGADVRFRWIDPLWSGADWCGHWFVFEQPRRALSRSERRDLERTVIELQASTATLPRERRNALVKLAASVS
jgi:hypothetical protein